MTDIDPRGRSSRGGVSHLDHSGWNPFVSVLAFFAGARGVELTGSERLSVPLQGVAVLFAGGWGGFAAYLATMFIAKPSVLAGLIFGVALIIVDTTIMWWRPPGRLAWLALMPRVVIIGSVAIVVSLIVDIWAFTGSILAQIKTNQETAALVARSYAYGPSSPWSVQIKNDQTEAANGAALVQKDQGLVNKDLAAYNDEIDHGSGADPIPGNGPVAQAKNAQLGLDRNTLSAETATAKADKAKLDADIANQESAQATYVTNYVAAKAGATDVLAREKALGQVANQNPMVNVIRWALFAISGQSTPRQSS